MSNGNRVFSNVIWRLAERFGAQFVAFIVSIILARLLTPEDYGTIALVTVFTTLLNVFVDSGFGTALIQKKDADDLDFSSVFYFNIVICIFLFAVMCIFAPLIADYYNRTDLTPVIRVLSFTLVISGVKNVQQAYVSRHMMFKKFFFATLGGTIGAAILGITLAYLGFGVWALVAQQLFNASVDTIVLWVTVRWRPKRCFSITRLKTLFSFGWRLLVSGLISTAYMDLRQLIIGKMYSSTDLAFYNQGDRIPKFIANNINASIDSVLLPAMSDAQDDCEHVKNMTRRSIKVSIYILAPIMTGLAVISDKIVLLILTEKWLPCVPYMFVFCGTLMFYPIHTCNLNAIKAMGRSDLFLKLEIIKSIIGIAVILCSMNISVWAICVSGILTSILSQIVNAYPNKKLLNYGYREQISDIIPTLLLACFMGAVVFIVGKIELNIIISLIIQVFLGASIYIIGSKVLNLDSYEYVRNIVISIVNKKNNSFLKRG